MKNLHRAINEQSIAKLFLHHVETKESRERKYNIERIIKQKYLSLSTSHFV